MENTHNSSVFQPFFSLQEAPPSTHFLHTCSSEWLSAAKSSACPACAAIACGHLLRPPPCTASQYCVQPSSSTSVVEAALCRSACKHDDDDGSVAHKLLPTITTCLSSPSLLSCCKEPVRETPYQKTLRLSTMKLHHCAEELGSESSDSSSNCGHIYSFNLMSSQSSVARNSVIASCESSPFASCLSPPSKPQKDQIAQCNPIPLIVSVRSAPNLECSSLGLRKRERAFPPPLTYTFPRSASADALTFSLRPCREGGRFILKEVKVPCRQNLHASRKNGRLTLQLFTADEGMKSSTEQEEDCAYSQEDDSNVMEEAENDEAASHGEAENDEVSMPPLKIREESSFRLGIVTNRSPSAKSFTLQAFTSDNGSMVDEPSCFDAFCTTVNRISSICPNNQSSASKGLSALSRARINRTAALCHSHSSSMLEVSPLLLMSQGEDNTVCQRKACRGIPCGMRGGKTVGMECFSSTFIFKDLGNNSLMGDVAKLVNSFGLNGAKFWERRFGPRERAREQNLASVDQDSSTMADDGIRSIRIAVKNLNERCTKEPCSIHILNLARKRRPQLANASEENCGKLIHGVSLIKSTATIRLHVELPLNLDWLHSAHNCKEPFDRNFISKGIPCLAIRS